VTDEERAFKVEAILGSHLQTHHNDRMTDLLAAEFAAVRAEEREACAQWLRDHSAISLADAMADALRRRGT